MCTLLVWEAVTVWETHLWGKASAQLPEVFTAILILGQKGLQW
jgi:hypothetical protein